MKTQFEQMTDGLNNVAAFLAGEQERFKAHPKRLAVKAIRDRLVRHQPDSLTRLDAIKHWEGGRRIPAAPARTLLSVIDKHPGAALTALNPAAFASAVASSKRTAIHIKGDRKRQSITKRKDYSAARVKRITKYTQARDFTPMISQL